MKTESPAPAPLVSDERIIGGRLEVGTLNPDYKLYKKPDHFRAPVFRTAPPMSPTEVRDIYESELSKMIAERDELVEKAKEAEEYLVMALGSDAFVRTPDPIQRWILKARALLSKYKTE